MKLESYEQYLYNELLKHEIQVNETQLSQFRIYAQMLIEWNEKMNLTAITELDEIYKKHFLDCILPSVHVKMEKKLCDVGAGAGFPSIPLKIMYPTLDVTIVEPLKKRCVFLNALIKELNINVNIVNARAEDYVKENRETFDIVSARAVANLPVLSELCIPLVKLDGVFLAMKGAQGLEELKEAEYAISLLGCKCILKDEYEMDQASRVNLVFKKVKKTPLKYPRMYAKIKKDPLVR